MEHISRRSFVRLAAAAVAGSRLAEAGGEPGRLPIAFSTLGCPKWEWETILRQASSLGYAAIELRGIRGEMDLTRSPVFAGDRLSRSLGELQALDLRIASLGASSRMHEPDRGRRAAQLDEGKRFIDLAHRLKAPYVRVFGDRKVQEEPKEKTVARIIAGLRELGDHAKGSGVTVLLESHGDFTDSPTLLEILRGAGMASVALLWDAHHTFVSSREDPAQTYKELGAYVRHIHLKDSIGEGESRRYVLTGSGTVPVRDTVRVLKTGGYRGYYCLEWEKAWHPEIEEPEAVFPHFARIMREYLA